MHTDYILVVAQIHTCGFPVGITGKKLEHFN